MDHGSYEFNPNSDVLDPNVNEVREWNSIFIVNMPHIFYVCSVGISMGQNQKVLLAKTVARLSATVRIAFSTLRVSRFMRSSARHCSKMSSKNDTYRWQLGVMSILRCIWMSVLRCIWVTDFC